MPTVRHSAGVQQLGQGRQAEVDAFARSARAGGFNGKSDTVGAVGDQRLLDRGQALPHALNRGLPVCAVLLRLRLVAAHGVARRPP